MEFIEFTNEQSRQFIDVTQVFSTWRDANARFEHSYKAAMWWAKRPNGEYLLATANGQDRSLGPRSPETERLKATSDAARDALKERKAKTMARLKEMARVNKALRLNRVPTMAARILREIDGAGLLGVNLHVVGTNALYAYEAKAAVLLSSALVATGDADLLWDARRGLRMAASQAKAEGVIGLLRKADKSFARLGPRGFRAINNDGYMVDLICPVEDARIQRKEKIGDADDELYGVEIFGLEWLINAPKIEEIVIGEDGLPLMMSCVDPRVYAMHKMWVSKQPDRKRSQRDRDAVQARLVAGLCRDYLNLRFNAPELSAVPIALRKGF